MKRRTFLRNSAAATGGLLIMQDLFARDKGPVYGHNGMRYSLDKAWSRADKDRFPVNDCHEMAQDKKGRIILLTNETKNNILIYDTKGKLLDSWGHVFPGAHGLTLHAEGGRSASPRLRPNDTSWIFAPALDCYPAPRRRRKGRDPLCL